MFALVSLHVFFSSFVIGPLVIVFWWVTWELFQRFPHVFPLWWQLVVSNILMIAIAIVRDPVLDLSHKGWHFVIFRRIFIYFSAVIGIGMWRASWVLMERNFKFHDTVACMIVGLLFFIAFKGISNVNAAPNAVSQDHDHTNVFAFPTMFKSESTENLWMYLLDCTFSVCVVGTLVVFVWRGLWCLLDIFLYPGNLAMSAWASLGIGYILVLLTFLLQPVIKYLAKVLNGVLRIFFVDIYLLFSFCGTINVWRGIWTLLNVYFLPDLPALSCFLTHSLCFLLLVLINSSNSILVRGVYVDGQEEGEQCVDFPCYYIRLFFQARQKRKLLQNAERRQKGRRRSEAAETLIPTSPSKSSAVIINHSEHLTNVV